MNYTSKIWLKQTQGETTKMTTITDKHLLVFFVLLAFTLHSIPIFFLPHTPLYDTDPWYTIHQVSLLNQNKPLTEDPLLNQNEDVTKWGEGSARIYSLFSLGAIEPVQIFYNLWLVPPLLLSLFLIILWLIIRDIFNSEAATYTVALLSVAGGFFFWSGLIGIIDHHLFEDIFGTLFILCMIGEFKAIDNNNNADCIIYLIGIASSLFFGGLNSHLFIIFLCIGIIILTILTILKVREKRSRILLLATICFGTIGTYFAIQKNLYLLFLAGTYTNELEPSSPIRIILIYSSALAIILIGAYYVLKSRDWKQISILSCTAILFCLSVLFVRFEYLAIPFVCIAAGIILSLYLKKYAIPIIAVFVTLSLVVNAAGFIQLNNSAQANSEISDGLQWLKEQPDGMVLSWWDYGFWIMGLSNKKPFTDPFQDNAKQAALMFLETNNTLLRTNLTQNNISYVIVSNKHAYFKDAMPHYAGIQQPAKEADTAYWQWCNRQNYTGTAIWIKGGTTIYRVYQKSQPTLADRNFTYAPHYVKFHFYPEFEGLTIVISDDSKMIIDMGKTNNKSDVVFEMFPSKIYTIRIEEANREYKISPKESEYNVQWI